MGLVLVRKLVEPLFEVAAWLAGQRAPESVAWDEEWGTETARFDLDNYEPTLPAVIDACLDALDVDLAKRTFVDLGSGKGRVVLQASRRPFLRVVGIEHHLALHEAAERNLAIVEGRRIPLAPVHLFHGDVRDHPLPEGPLAVFLYNPFGAHVLAGVLERLRARDVRLIYVNPVDEAIVEAAGWRVVREGGEVKPWLWRIYRPPE
jgi:hypothetical protein